MLAVVGAQYNSCTLQDSATRGSQEIVAERQCTITEGGVIRLSRGPESCQKHDSVARNDSYETLLGGVNLQFSCFVMKCSD